MAIISSAQARQYAAQAGFSGASLDKIVAIAQAESGLNTDAQARNNDGSIDRGILQINSRWHPEVSNACAYNAACSFREGYRISSRGTNFSPWSAYNNGAYLRYLSGGASGAVAGKPWYQYSQSRGWDPSVPHYAIDLPMPLDTSLFFLQGPGTVTKAGYQAWGGEVYYDPDPPGGPQEYFLHLDNVFVQVGQKLRGGQIIGTSGGQTSGGDHPASTQWSTGLHAHWGIFERYQGGLPYGPDPSGLLQAAREGKLPIGEGGDAYYMDLSSGQGQVEEKSPTPLSYRVNSILSEFPGFAGIAIALDEASQFPPAPIWYDTGTKVVDPGVIGTPINQVYGALFDTQNYIGAAIRSVIDNIISYSVPFLFRSMIVFVGLLLLAGLIWHAASESGLTQTAMNIGTRGLGSTVAGGLKS